LKNPDPPEGLLARLESTRRPVLLTHIYPDGDAVGSELGLYHGLRARDPGVSPRIVNTHPVPEKYGFLDPDGVVDVMGETLASRQQEAFDQADLVKEAYSGIRPAPGYPCQPDHTEKETLFKLLDAGRIGMELTSSFAMTPAASVSGLYMAHPESVYFAVGRIERDQVEDYARRKGMKLRTAERWLGPILNYDPGEAEVEAA